MNSKRVMGGRVTINLPDTNVTECPVAPFIVGNRAAVASVWTDAACTAAYTTGGVRGDHLYFKLSEARTFNSEAKVSAWDTADEDAPNLIKMIVVKSLTRGGITVVEVMLEEADAANTLDDSEYLFHTDTVFSGALIHAWCHSGDITTVTIHQKLAAGIFSPNLLGDEANWADPLASDLSPDSPAFLVDAELYIDSTCDNDTVLELIIDPWVKGHAL